MKKTRSIFKEKYNKISYPISDENRIGLRKAQIGAIFAIGSHFTNSKEKSIITMPTGELTK